MANPIRCHGTKRPSFRFARCTIALFTCLSVSSVTTEPSWAAGTSDAAPTVCATAAHAEFDFWLGEWQIEQSILAADGTRLRLPARTRVEKDLAGCALIEHWQGDVQFFWEGMQAPERMSAISVRARDPASGRWRIHWMDSRAPRFDAPYEGGFVDGRGEFYRDAMGADGSQRGRILFVRRDDDHVDWSLAISSDGGERWTELWRMAMTRVVEPD